MASNQKKRCDEPSLAAAPTQVEPTTNRIWVRARSARPSGFFRDALWASTFCSASRNSIVAIARLRPLILPAQLAWAAAVQYGIRDDEFSHRRRRYSSRRRATRSLAKRSRRGGAWRLSEIFWARR